MAAVQSMLGNRSRTTVNVTDPPSTTNSSSTPTAMPRPTTSDRDAAGNRSTDGVVTVVADAQQRVAEPEKALDRPEGRQHEIEMRSDHHDTELHQGETVNQKPLPATNQEQLVIDKEEGRKVRGGGVGKEPSRGEAAADGRRDKSRPTAENSWTSEHRNMVVEKHGHRRDNTL